MSAKDRFHSVVKTALRKDGWDITDDPLHFRFGGVEIFIDLAAEKLIAAEKNGEKIAVEVKSFLGGSAISEFHTALGQFMNYRAVLGKKDPERLLYLAVPQESYDSFFLLEFTQMMIQQYQIKLIVYDLEQEAIAQWHK